MFGFMTCTSCTFVFKMCSVFIKQVVNIVQKLLYKESLLLLLFTSACKCYSGGASGVHVCLNQLERDAAER